MFESKEDKTLKENPPPSIEVDEKELSQSQFTTAGIQRFNQTLSAYSRQLFAKSILFADSERVDNYDLEVTEKHVRTAASEMTKSFGKKRPPSWIVFSQAGEYICTGIAGAGASNLNQTWGIVCFGLGLTIGIALFVLRTVKTHQ